MKAIENDKVFITDEFWLAEDAILQTINIALDPADENVFNISYKKKKEIIHFFIEC